MMKITVKDKEPKTMPTFDSIRTGIVFQFSDDVLALKLVGNNALLLNYHTGEEWLNLAGDHKKEGQIKRILGKIDEIIVIPEE